MIAAIAPIIVELRAEIAALKEAQADAMKYRGVWKQATPYRKGEAVTHAGALWVREFDGDDGTESRPFQCLEACGQERRGGVKTLDQFVSEIRAKWFAHAIIWSRCSRKRSRMALTSPRSRSARAQYRPLVRGMARVRTLTAPAIDCMAARGLSRTGPMRTAEQRRAAIATTL